jgi:2-dehydro-3-deoxyphosphogluconate aldolase/(4S)-4-hydroxy-2-oxoglutarate aldolase
MTLSPVERIGAARVLPVLRTRDADETVDVVAGLAAAGVDVIEITTTIAGWDTALERVQSDHPQTCVGVGTVLTADSAHAALARGAEFLVSPRLVPAVRAVAHEAGTLFIEGGLTPTELMTALDAGGIAKLFPAHTVGPDYLRSLLSVVPHARIVPTGGIPLSEVGTWLDAGAFAVGVGRDLTAAGDIAARLRDLGLA